MLYAVKVRIVREETHIVNAVSDTTAAERTVSGIWDDNGEDPEDPPAGCSVELVSVEPYRKKAEQQEGEKQR
jgi:hypothetical protein